MIVVVSAVTFVLLSTAGGDAFSSLRNNPQVSEETIERLRKTYGLDRPLPERYAVWLSNAVTGEFGESFYFREPVMRLLASRLVSTLLLAGAALLIAIAAAVSLSLAAARFPGRIMNAIVDTAVLLTASTPRIVLALAALAISARYSLQAADSYANSVSILFLSAAALSAPLISVFLAQSHSGLRDAMTEDFVTLARGKGLSEWAVILKHASRAALNPVLTVFGLSLGALLGGSVVVETIMGRSGLGSAMVTAVRTRDVPLVMGIVFITSVSVWAGNAIAEYLQMLNDKRLRTAENT